MKCLVIFLAFVALSSASLLRWEGHGVQKEIRVDGNWRIFIRNGWKMVVFQVPSEDPASIDIVVKEPGRMVKKMRIGSNKQIIKQVSVVPRVGLEELYVGSFDWDTEVQPSLDNQQMKVLVNIFSKYHGLIGEASFYQILKEVKEAVNNHQLHSVFYDVISDLEVKPTNQVNTHTTEAEEEHTTIRVGDEAAKQRNRDNERHTDDTQKHEDQEQKGKEDEVLQATRQIEWIQNLVANKRKQQQEDLPRQEDVKKIIESFLKTSSEYSRHKDYDVKFLVIQTNIQELQRDIIQKLLESQQLQLQQQFLRSQKQQLKLHQQTGQQQGLQQEQLQELHDAYDKLYQQERNLVDEQLNIQKIIHRLQESLAKQFEHYKDDLKRENERYVKLW